MIEDAIGLRRLFNGPTQKDTIKRFIDIARQNRTAFEAVLKFVVHWEYLGEPDLADPLSKLILELEEMEGQPEFERKDNVAKKLRATLGGWGRKLERLDRQFWDTYIPDSDHLDDFERYQRMLQFDDKKMTAEQAERARSLHENRKKTAQQLLLQIAGKRPIKVAGPALISLRMDSERALIIPVLDFILSRRLGIAGPEMLIEFFEFIKEKLSTDRGVNEYELKYGLELAEKFIAEAENPLIYAIGLLVNYFEIHRRQHLFGKLQRKLAEGTVLGQGSNEFMEKVSEDIRRLSSHKVHWNIAGFCMQQMKKEGSWKQVANTNRHLRLMRIR